MTTQEVKRKLAAILSADVKGYSRLVGEDEEATLQQHTKEDIGLYRKFMAGRLSRRIPARRAGHTEIRHHAMTPQTGQAIMLAVICILGVSLRGYAASDSERITFKSADSAVSAPIPATVFRPKGSGPFPGVVLLHVCSGIRAYDSKWAEWLGTLGYVAILPDSLSPRHVSSACGGGGLTFREHALDGLGALAYLRSQPDVIPNKVAVMGWSHGAAATLISASARFINATHPEGGGYQAAIAFYPNCAAFQDGNLATPLLMLMGSADDWTPSDRCIDRGTALQSAGTPIEWKVYKGAMHTFDDPRPNRVVRISGRTYHLGYDRTAAQDAYDQVQRFLTTYLQ
jgi:dienelactone hydrolase